MQLTMPGFDLPKYALVPERVARKPAAAPAKPTAQSQRDTVLEVIRQRGNVATHEIAAYCRLTAHEVGKRVPELVAAGLVRATEETRKSPAGRASTVWSLA